MPSIGKGLNFKVSSGTPLALVHSIISHESVFLAAVKFRTAKVPAHPTAHTVPRPYYSWSSFSQQRSRFLRAKSAENIPIRFFRHSLRHATSTESTFFDCLNRGWTLAVRHPRVFQCWVEGLEALERKKGRNGWDVALGKVRLVVQRLYLHRPVKLSPPSVLTT